MPVIALAFDGDRSQATDFSKEKMLVNEALNGSLFQWPTAEVGRRDPLPADFARERRVHYRRYRQGLERLG